MSCGRGCSQSWRATSLRSTEPVDATDFLERFGQEMQAGEGWATGLLSSIRKARGQALRLALALELLWWCVDEGEPEPQPQPQQLGADTMQAIAALMRSYFLPMEARMLGTQACRRKNATPARWRSGSYANARRW